MGLPASPWDNSSLNSKGGIAYGTITCENWPPTSLHHIGATVQVPIDLSIDATLAANPDTKLLGPFYSTDMNVEPLRVRKTVYPPMPFVGLFLERYLMPLEAWNRLRSAIVNEGI